MQNYEEKKLLFAVFADDVTVGVSTTTPHYIWRFKKPKNQFASLLHHPEKVTATVQLSVVFRKQNATHYAHC